MIMRKFPRVKTLDSTLKAARKGYLFVTDTCRELNTDIFSTRFLGKKTVCMRGNQAAELLYNTEYFERKKVAPNLVKATLFGHGGVQEFDGAEHRHRKQMFMSLMGREDIIRLAELTVSKWTEYANKWEKEDEIILFKEVEKLLFEAVCEWSGIELKPDEIESRAEDNAAMVDSVGSLGKRHWKGRLARIRTEKWVEKIVQEVRSNDDHENDSKVLQRFAWYEDLDGNLIDSKTVAVEVINIIRPTVAISRYITFAALALHWYPESRDKIADSEEYLTNFVQEVRRFFPFFPFVMARVKKDFDWKDYHFRKGLHVLLDLYGTNHHPFIWENPELFNPDRFDLVVADSFNLIPQGGGDYDQNHRCAGEWITIKVLKESVRFLAEAIRYNVPPQDLSIDLSRIPAIPNSRFIIKNVRRKKQNVEVKQDFSSMASPEQEG